MAAAIGSCQSTASAPRSISQRDQLYVPEAGSSITKWAVCAFSLAAVDDDLTVNLPNASTAIDGGKAFAGIYSGETTVLPTGGDSQIWLQKSGVAKAYLKANVASTKGMECGYDPADAGYVQPITAVNRGKLVPIGRFTQTKASSASPQCVGVQLLEPQQIVGGALSVAVADGTAYTNSTTETTLGSVSVPANFMTQVGQELNIFSRVDVTSGNGTDTLVLKAYLGNTLIGQSPTVDVTDGGGDIGLMRLLLTARTVGNAGTAYAAGDSALGFPAIVVMRATGSASEITAIDWTAAQTISIKGTWSAASASNSCKLTMLTVKG